MNGPRMTTETLARMQREARALLISYKDKLWSPQMQYTINDEITDLLERYDVSCRYICVGRLRKDGSVPISGITADAQILIWAIFVAPLIELEPVTVSMESEKDRG